MLLRSATSSLKANALSDATFVTNWFNYRYADLEVQATSEKNVLFLEQLVDSLEQSSKPVEEFVGSYSWSKIIDNHTVDLHRFAGIYSYNDFLMIDSKGNILYTVAEQDDLGKNLFTSSLASTRLAQSIKLTLKNGKPTFSDLESYAPFGGDVVGFLAMPLLDENGDIIGVVALQVTGERINLLVQDNEDRSHDTYLVGEDLYARSLITDNDSALNVKVDTEQSRLWVKEHFTEHGKHHLSEDDEDEVAFSYIGPLGNRVLGIHRNVKVANVNWGIINEVSYDVAFKDAITLKTIMITVWSITALLVVTMSILISRRIVKPLILLTDAAEVTSSGELREIPSLNVSNEISDLALSFNRMVGFLQRERDELKKREWFNTGHSDLSDNMRGMQHVRELTENVLEHLSCYLHADVGSFYLVDDTEEFLEFCSGFAYKHDGRMERIPLGEGVLGQAAKDKKIVCKQDLPDGYLTIYSSLGQASVKSILIAPLIFDDQLVGVIELGSTTGFSSEAIEYIANMTESVSVALRTVKSSEMVSSLLDESNKQAVLLKDSESRLQVINDELEQSSQYKSEFLANMSHEIRTPMNGVIGMTGLLASTKLDDEQRGYLDTIKASGEGLLLIINDILDFSKIEAGKLEIENIDFGLKVMLDDFSKTMSFKTDEKGLELICDIDSTIPCFVKGDPGRLRQILTNLVSNAIKFTEQGEIVISCSTEKLSDDTVNLKFEVTDTGIGISPEKHKVLFQQFTQADGSTTRNYGGTGLGLAISKQLSELMHGEIGVNSSVGGGSTFWFTVQLMRSSKVAAPLTLGHLEEARILVVDDNATNREVLGKMLDQWGVENTSASNGEDALAVLKGASVAGKAFDIAILDMQMPVMDGEQLGAAIVSDQSLKQPHMILLSSMGQRGDAARLKQIGFNGSLHKPISQSDLYNALSQLMGFEEEKHKDDEFVTIHTLHENLFDGVEVLLVEDNIVNQKVASGVLKNIGLHSEAASNGEEALEAMELKNYDIILMDMQMPVMDGLTATRKIRERERAHGTARVPIIAMTANAMIEDKDQCIDAGMDDYISKPIGFDLLKKTMVKWLQKKL